jgi:hypothetical protein
VFFRPGRDFATARPPPSTEVLGNYQSLKATRSGFRQKAATQIPFSICGALPGRRHDRGCGFRWQAVPSLIKFAISDKRTGEGRVTIKLHLSYKLEFIQ